MFVNLKSWIYPILFASKWCADYIELFISLSENEGDGKIIQNPRVYIIISSKK